MRNFHAHIYFDLHQKAEASLIVARLLALKLPDVKHFKDYDLKVGPHYLPMAEVHFTHESIHEVLKCLRQNHNDLSILVHEDTGDDVGDHLHPIWVGTPLPIDFDFFERVKANPSISVH